MRGAYGTYGKQTDEGGWVRGAYGTYGKQTNACRGLIGTSDEIKTTRKF